MDKAPENYDNRGLATVYMNIGSFYRDITTKVNEASDNGMYIALFENVKTLMNTVAIDENESEIVRLELIEMTRNILHQYPTRLKRDGVGKEEIDLLYSQIEEILDSINVPNDDEDKAYIMKQNIIKMLADTKNSVDAAYGTSKGGDS